MSSNGIKMSLDFIWRMNLVEYWVLISTIVWCVILLWLMRVDALLTRPRHTELVSLFITSCGIIYFCFHLFSFACDVSVAYIHFALSHSNANASYNDVCDADVHHHTRHYACAFGTVITIPYRLSGRLLCNSLAFHHHLYASRLSLVCRFCDVENWCVCVFHRASNTWGNSIRLHTEPYTQRADIN